MTGIKNGRFIAMLLAVVMVFSTMPMTTLTAYAATTSGNTTEFAGGSGTEEDPYLVSTKNQFYNVRNYPSAYFLQMNDIVFSDADFARGGDFYNGGYGWEAFDFSGSYDGGNYKIENLRGVEGLFANLSGATVKNVDLCANIRFEDRASYTMGDWGRETFFGVLGWEAVDSEISNCSVSGVLVYKNSTASSKTNFWIGTICGCANNSTIQFCTNNMEIALSVSHPDARYSYSVRLGGICGASIEGSTISDCENYSSLNEDENRYFCDAGGIVGYVKNTTILNCTNYGNLSADCCSVGGIIGGVYGGGIITDCANYGTIYGERAGGICGESYGTTITNCNNFGAVESKYTAGGGICGRANGGEVSKCSNFAEISSEAVPIGGIIGKSNNCEITGCVNQGEVYGWESGGIAGVSTASINDCYNLGKVRGNCSGGICGKLSEGVVQRCYNTGTVTAREAVSSGVVGGIVGDNAASVKDCYNIGQLVAAKADSCLGGVSGKLSGTIDSCYSIGKVEQVGNFGGICGNNEDQDAGNITGCFFMREDNLYAVGIGYGDATALSMDEMRLANSFPGFDFDAVWTMAGNEDYLYPELKSVEMIYSCNHNYGKWTKVDDTSHSKTCSICQNVQKEAHKWDNGTTIKQANCKEDGQIKYTCTTCSATRTESIAKLTTHTYDHACDTDCNVCGATRATTHDYKTSWSFDKTNHWHQCSVCRDRKDVTAHTPGEEATETKDQTCTICGYVIKAALGHTHKYASTWTTDENGHWYACSGCEKKSSYAAHDFENACDKDCSICGYTRETDHKFAEAWTTDADKHWHECSDCGLKQDEAAHEPGTEATTAQTCTICGYEIVPALGNEETEVPDENVGTTTPTTPTDKIDPEDGIFSWLVLVVAVVAVGGVAAVIIIKKKK